jgi:hypothetical protein
MKGSCIDLLHVLSFNLPQSSEILLFITEEIGLGILGNLCKITCVPLCVQIKWDSKIPTQISLSLPLVDPVMAVGWEQEAEPNYTGKLVFYQGFGVDLTLNIPEELPFVCRKPQISHLLNFTVGASGFADKCTWQVFSIPSYSWRYYLAHFFDGWRGTNRF